MASPAFAAVMLLAAGMLVATAPDTGPTGSGGDGSAPGLRPVALASAGQRVAYIGTGHRGIGVITGEGATATAEPFLPGTPARYDDDVSTRGDTITWTSLRESPSAEVYVRVGDGEATRLTVNDSVEGHPVVSPDGGRIAFHSNLGRPDGGHDIFVVGTGGGEPVRVTDAVGDNTWPSWSPDGSTIAFQGRRATGPPQVYQVPAEGGAVSPLTGIPDGAGEPAWDPNPANGRLVITLTPDNPATRVLAVLRPGNSAQALGTWDGHRASWSPDGTTLVLLSTNPPGSTTRDGLDRVYTGVPSADLCSCELTLRLDEDRQVGTPTWYVPAGGESRILVGRSSAPDRLTATLQDVRPDGADPRDLGITVLREDPGAAADPNLIYRPNAGDPWFGRPAYSPDGKRIAVTRFETVDGQRTARTWIAAADGSSPTLIELDDRVPGGVDKAPAWSPDGTLLALAVQAPGGPFRIVVVDPSTGRRVLTVPGSNADPPVSDLNPAWSPDGMTLAFTRGDPDAADPSGRVWLASAVDGGGQVDLTAKVCGDCVGYGQPIVDYAPAFSPDGTRIAFSRRDDGVIVTDLNGGSCQVVLPAGGLAACDTAISAGPGGPYAPRDAVWSADGQHLAYSARRSADGTSAEAIGSVDLSTGTCTWLTANLPGRQKYPTVQRAIDISTSLVEPPAPTTVGSDTALTIGVRNNGPDPSPLTHLSVDVPGGLRLTGLEPGAGRCEVAAANCELGRLDPERSVEIRVTLTGVSVGTFTVSWSAVGDTADTNPQDNQASTPVRVDDAPQPTTPPPTTAPPTTAPPTTAPPTTPPPTTVPPTTPPPTTPPPTTPPPTTAPPTAPARPQITVVVTPRPAYVGGRATVRYTIRNAGGTRSAGTTVRPTLPRGVPVASLPAQCPSLAGCRIADLNPGGSVSFAIVLAPTAAIRTTVRGTVNMTGAGSATATAPLVVLQPRIVALPELGPPGFVTSIRGTDFPPGVPVRLSWDVGVTVAANPAIPRADGTFHSQLLVLWKDRLGPRQVIARGSGFGPVRCDFLVIVPAQQPPRLVQRR